MNSEDVCGRGGERRGTPKKKRKGKKKEEKKEPWPVRNGSACSGLHLATETREV